MNWQKLLKKRINTNQKKGNKTKVFWNIRWSLFFFRRGIGFHGHTRVKAETFNIGGVNFNHFVVIALWGIAKI